MEVTVRAQDGGSREGVITPLSLSSLHYVNDPWSRATFPESLIESDSVHARDMWEAQSQGMGLIRYSPAPVSDEWCNIQFIDSYGQVHMVIAPEM